jgi:hypothetical protein
MEMSSDVSKIFATQQNHSARLLKRFNLIQHNQFQKQLQYLRYERDAKLKSIEIKQERFYRYLNRLEQSVNNIHSHLTKADIEKFRSDENSKKIRAYAKRKTVTFKLNEPNGSSLSKPNGFLLKTENNENPYERKLSSATRNDIETLNRIKHLRSSSNKKSNHLLSKDDIDDLIYLELAYQRLIESKVHFKQLNANSFSCHDTKCQRSYIKLKTTKLFDYEHFHKEDIIFSLNHNLKSLS